MNWGKFLTYGQAPDKAFEMLCNQLFENWCQETYKDQLASFTVVNGAGGDGGVESYAVLKDGGIIGLQAKWFLTSIQDSQIRQIKSSIETALKIRPRITTYIVCMPRDLGSETAKGKSNENSRWEKLKEVIKVQYPDLEIILWNDTTITTQMQKPTSAGIHKYWFVNAELTYEIFPDAFSRAKRSWLSTKYVPDLNVTGKINCSLLHYVGDYKEKEKIYNQLTRAIHLCEEYNLYIQELISICHNASQEYLAYLNKSKKEINSIYVESQKILSWIKNEFTEKPSFDVSTFQVSFHSIIQGINEYEKKYTTHTSHVIDVKSILSKLAGIDFNYLIETIHECLNDQCILFLGNPGTGKTNGIAAFAEKMLNEKYHIPIVIQASDIPADYSWRDILIHVLGCSSSWDEEELWQALINSANRSRFEDASIEQEIKIIPKVTIFVDGIDESSAADKWIERMQAIETITENHPQIKFCFTSRPAPFSPPITYAKVIQLSDGGDTPVHKLFDNYIKTYQITVQNCLWLKYALNTPMALKLFCELYKGQAITISDISEVSMNELWRKKIEKIQKEFDKNVSTHSHNTYILSAIVALSACFTKKPQLEQSEIIKTIRKNAKVDNNLAEKILNHIESYGIIVSFCKPGKGIAPDTYVYYSGIQGYFDYASALYLIKKFFRPCFINFKRYKGININTLYCLAIISIQKYNYLITRNRSFKKAYKSSLYSEMQFYALQHSTPEAGSRYKKGCLKIMQKNAVGTTVIVNNLVLPLSRNKQHPLGASLLDEFLNSFNKPAQRDVLWSLPPNLRDSEGKKWGKNNNYVIMDDEEYILAPEDTAEGLPLIYAWFLANVNNTIRRRCRDSLMEWSRVSPREFNKLFLHFADVNDPQIKSDLYAIMMCLIYDRNDEKLTTDVSDWILTNVLSPSRIDQIRDISVRYYAIAIIEKAKMLGIYTDEEVKAYLPPYHADNYDIKLNKDALSGTMMEGYSAIHYDLSRYVLIEQINRGFNSWNNKQIEDLICKIGNQQPDYINISSDQFILSAAYAYLLQMGWNEEEFYNRNKDKSGNWIGGVDLSIRKSYHSADHGEQSNIMTVCEKYVWAARNNIFGFLCDRLLFGDNKTQIVNYNLLSTIRIPIQELYETNPDNEENEYKMYCPEPQMIAPENGFDTKESLITYIRTAPEVNWEKWIYVNNNNSAYSIGTPNLLALHMAANFDDISGIQTLMFLDSIVLPQKEITQMIAQIHDVKTLRSVFDDYNCFGCIETSCYISPKEACWFTWKKRFECTLADDFPGLNIQAAVDRCVYNSEVYGDIEYSLPSLCIRRLLGIIDTDDYQYFDKNNNVCSEYFRSGERWGTNQEYVLVSQEDTIQKLNEKGLSLVWLMRDIRSVTTNANEKFRDVFADRCNYYIAYYEGMHLKTEKVFSDFIS